MVVKMEFEEPVITRQSTNVVAPSGLTGFLIKNGVVKNSSQANTLFIFIIVAAIIFIFFFSSEDSDRTVVPASEIVNQQQFLP